MDVGKSIAMNPSNNRQKSMITRNTHTGFGSNPLLNLAHLLCIAMNSYCYFLSDFRRSASLSAS